MTLNGVQIPNKFKINPKKSSFSISRTVSAFALSLKPHPSPKTQLTGNRSKQTANQQDDQSGCRDGKHPWPDQFGCITEAICTIATLSGYLRRKGELIALQNDQINKKVLISLLQHEK